ncbi:MAG: DUF5667 domain-containing protein, partial [Patescibacteria group bacterium]
MNFFTLWGKKNKEAEWRKAFSPEKEFEESARRVFLAMFRAKFPRVEPASLRFAYFVRGLASGIAVMLIISGAAVYADQANVGPESVLYGLKRTQQAVRVFFAGEEEKSIAHLELAERRVEEIENMKSQNPQNPSLVK